MTEEEIKLMYPQAIMLHTSLEKFSRDLRYKIEEWEHYQSTTIDDELSSRYKRNIRALDNAKYIIDSHAKMCKKLQEDVEFAQRIMKW